MATLDWVIKENFSKERMYKQTSEKKKSQPHKVDRKEKVQEKVMASTKAIWGILLPLRINKQKNNEHGTNENIFKNKENEICQCKDLEEKQNSANIFIYESENYVESLCHIQENKKTWP